MADSIEWVLLVEVAKDQRIRCDYQACNHSVYRRIHVLKYPDGRYQCIGSGCFKKLCGDENINMIKSPSVNYYRHGKSLNQEQRQQLIDNRSKLLDKLLEQGLQNMRATPLPPRRGQADKLLTAVPDLGEPELAIEPEAEPVNISGACAVENYHLLRKYLKFNSQINYAAFPQGEKYSRALDMVKRKYRDLGVVKSTASVTFQREVQTLVDDMVDYSD